MLNRIDITANNGKQYEMLVPVPVSDNEHTLNIIDKKSCETLISINLFKVDELDEVILKSFSILQDIKQKVGNV